MGVKHKKFFLPRSIVWHLKRKWRTRTKRILYRKGTQFNMMRLLSVVLERSTRGQTRMSGFTEHKQAGFIGVVVGEAVKEGLGLLGGPQLGSTFTQTLLRSVLQA